MSLSVDEMELDELAPRGLDRPTVLALSVRSDARGLARLSGHLALLLATGSAVWLCRGTPFVVVALIGHGVVLDFLFCAMHESVHRTPFASRWLNDAVGWVTGALLLLPLEYFRLFHFAHHRYTQDPRRDPELAVPKPNSIGALLWHCTGLPNWRARLATTLRHALTGKVPQPFVPPAKHGRIVAEARILWAVYALVLAASVALRSDAALIYWIVPAMLGQPFLRLYLLAEHMGCAENDDMYANTRTTYTNPAVRLLAWNMPFHVEHHAFPSVPFHALPAVNRLVRARIQVGDPGYRAVCRKLLLSVSRSGSLPAASR